MFNAGLYSSSLLLRLHGRLSAANRLSSNRKYYGAGTNLRNLLYAFGSLLFQEIGSQGHDPDRDAWMGRSLRTFRNGGTRPSSVDDTRRSDPPWRLLRFLFRHGFHVHG